MKKILFSVMILSSLSYAKKTENWNIQNTEFEKVKSVLPETKKDVVDGSTTYTVGVLEPIKNDDYLEFSSVKISNLLYTFNTQKETNKNILNKYDNYIKFDYADFLKGSKIVLRTNIDNKIGDFVEFRNLQVEGGSLMLEILDYSNNPRFIKLHVLTLPYNQGINVEMKPLYISGVEYILNKKKVGDNIVYYIEPLYNSESEYLKYLEYENSKTFNNIGKLEKKSKINLLREKVTITKDGNLIYTSNIVDVFDK